MEYHSNKDAAVAIRIFKLGLQLFSEDVPYILRYLNFLITINDDQSKRLITLHDADSRFSRAFRAVCRQSAGGQSPTTLGRLGAVRILVR